jgi:hypothetical protein
VVHGTLADSRLESSGRLRRRHLPAVYAEPGFLARYWEACRPDDPGADGRPEGEPEGHRAAPAGLDPAEQAAFAALHRRVAAGALPINVVVSSLALLGLLEQLLEGYRERVAAREAQITTEEAHFHAMRFQSTCHRLLGDRLKGMLQVDLQGFSLASEEVWEQLPAALLLQGRRGSLLHVLAARHLGCTHLATLDGGTARACALLETQQELTPVTSAESLLRLLTG